MEQELKGILVFYIDVGQLPPFKAEAFVERMRDKLNERRMVDRLQKQGYEVMWLPVRPGSNTRIEMVPLSPGCVPVIASEVKIEDLIEEE